MILNQSADQIANTIRTTFIGPINRRGDNRFDGIHIEDKSMIKINDVNKWIRMQIKGDEIKAYIMKRNDWNKKTVTTIALDSLGKSIGTLKPEKQLSVLQLIHNWQNTGEQKRKFLLGNIQKKNRLVRQEEIEIMEQELCNAAQCPFKCGKSEGHLHFMECTHHEAYKKRKTLIDQLKQRLNAKNVYGPIISFIVNGLMWTEDQVIFTYRITMTRADLIINDALDDQYNIGWKHIRRGLISHKWILAQQTYIDETKATERYDWGKLIIYQIIQVSWGMWTWWNKALHGPSKKDQEKKKTEILHRKIDQLYDRISTITHHNTP